MSEWILEKDHDDVIPKGMLVPDFFPLNALHFVSDASFIVIVVSHAIRIRIINFHALLSCSCLSYWR